MDEEAVCAKSQGIQHWDAFAVGRVCCGCSLGFSGFC